MQLPRGGMEMISRGPRRNLTFNHVVQIVRIDDGRRDPTLADIAIKLPEIGRALFWIAAEPLMLVLHENDRSGLALARSRRCRFQRLRIIRENWLMKWAIITRRA